MPLRTPHRNQDPGAPEEPQPQEPAQPAPKAKSTFGSKLKWALGGIAVGVLGAIGYDLYRKGKQALTSDDDKPRANPALPGAMAGYGAPHTTVIGLPMPGAYTPPQPQQFQNPAWGPFRNEDELELYEKAEKLAEKRNAKRRARLEELMQEFENDS